MKMIVTDPKAIALQFNDCVNSRDIKCLEHLMTDDHVFIDKTNNVKNGKQTCLKSWKGFFEMFPDYKNIFRTITAKDNLVIIVGHSTCSDVRLDGRAIWTAKIQHDQVAEWRVYEYSTGNKQGLGISEDQV